MDAEQLSSKLKTVLAAIELADIPRDLRETAFKVSLETVLDAAQPTSAGPAATPTDAPQGQPGQAMPKSAAAPGREPMGQDDPVGRIAAKAGVSREVVESVYEWRPESGELEVVVPSTRISEGNRDGSLELTLLYVAGRQAAGLDETTPLKDARAVCDNYNRADSNYARNITGSRRHRGLSNEMRFRGGQQSREARMTAPGYDTWRELLQRLVS